LNDRLSSFEQQESAFYSVVKKNSDLPALIKGYDEIPVQLEKDERFLEMVDTQFEMLQRLIGESLPSVGVHLPADTSLVLPAVVFDKLK
jgi:hypothetical protein